MWSVCKISVLLLICRALFFYGGLGTPEISKHFETVMMKRSLVYWIHVTVWNMLQTTGLKRMICKGFEASQSCVSKAPKTTGQSCYSMQVS